MTLQTGEPDQPQQATDPNLPPLVIDIDDDHEQQMEELLVHLSAPQTTGGTDPDLAAMSLETPMAIEPTAEQLERRRAAALRIRARIRREQQSGEQRTMREYAEIMGGSGFGTALYASAVHGAAQQQN